MKEDISRFINDFNSLEIKPDGINDQIRYFIQKTKELISYLNSKKVKEFYIKKFDYIEHLSNQIHRNEINHIKHHELKLKQKDTILILKDNFFRGYYLNIH